MKTQRGFVLIIALLMLLAVTGIAVSLLSTSTVDNQMAGAADESERALIMIQGVADLSISNEVNKTGDGVNDFTLTGKDLFASPRVIYVDNTRNASSQMTILTDTGMPTDCPANYLADVKLKCNFMQVQSTTNYGRGNRHQKTVTTHVVQQMREQ